MREEDETQAIEYDRSPTYNEAEEEKKHEREEAKTDETNHEV